MNTLIAYDSNNQPLQALYQWDINQVITFKNVKLALGASSLPVFHLSNCKCSDAFVVYPISEYTVDGNNETDLDILIPYELLQSARPIDIYLYERNDVNFDGYRTTAHTKLNIIPRSKPDTYESDIIYRTYTFTAPGYESAALSLPEQGGGEYLYLHRISSQMQEYKRMIPAATKGESTLYIRTDGDSTMYPLEYSDGYGFIYNFIPATDSYRKKDPSEPAFHVNLPDQSDEYLIFWTTYKNQKKYIIYEKEV